MASSFEYNYSLVVMEECDIDDPCVHVDLDNLPQYDRNHLINWLKYRGDCLKSLDSMKDIRTRVLQYFKNGTDNNLVDPTLDLKWKKEKVLKYNIFVPKLKYAARLNTVPDILKHDVGDIQKLDGWSKKLFNMPTFTIEHIDKYYEKVNNAFSQNSTKVKKHFHRGEQLLEESFLDVGSVVVKENLSLFCIKGVCAASMKNMNRWVTVAISKFPVEVYFAYCQCAAGKPGTCSHVFALFKLLAKWAIEKVSYVPTPVACTSRPCTWSVVQSRGRVVKPAIADLTITAPKRQNKEETTTSKKLKGIKSTLYDARSTTTRIVNYEKLDKLMLTLKNENPSVPALMAINQDATQSIHTQFGEMPLGSLLSLHLPLIPPNFNIYYSVDLSATPAVGFYIYPPFPCNDSENKMNPYLKNISVEKNQFLEDLRISRDDVDKIEQRTRMQVDEPEWFNLRKHRLTASLNNKCFMSCLLVLFMVTSLASFSCIYFYSAYLLIYLRKGLLSL